MTLNGAITELVLLSEHPMMPVIFKPGIQKVIETISELEAQPEPCEDAVSREAAIDAIISFFKLTDYNESAYAVRTVLGDLPPVAPKQRTGKWIPSDSQCGIRCSVCGVPVDDFCRSIDYIDLDYEPNFCPNCGLPMKGINNADTEI